jgi:hypothetical protein
VGVLFALLASGGALGRVLVAVLICVNGEVFLPRAADEEGVAVTGIGEPQEAQKRA